ncbi:MFS transporter [Leifsonia kafniensis]|uniref:MFS transporter n=1 Tax=Leifsonia kafniensis TaxID=475957 RepID=A0ABP7KZV5_9MICO
MTDTLPAAPSAATRAPQRKLLVSLFAINAMLLACYAAFMTIFVPQQVSLVDEANKVGNLALVMTASAIGAVIIHPLVGAWSDRTRSRLGRRAPWILAGAGGAALFMMLLVAMNTLLWITVVWVLLMLALNALGTAVPAVVTDHFPRERRGVASAVIGMGTIAGMGIGVVGAGVFVENIGVGYAAFAVGIFLVAVAYVLLNRDASSADLVLRPFSWKQFLGGFWVNPIRYPDFAWAFSARFLMILAYQGVQTYLLYVLTDFIGLGVVEAAGLAGLLTITQLVAALLSTYVSGRISDRTGRRKIFVIASSLLMGGALVIPLVTPTVAGMFALAFVFGLGYGVYLSVDLALMTEVLPDEEGDAAKDLGILNVATTLPQALTPLVAWMLISLTGGYASIFVAGIVFAVLGALAILPIKSVR